MWFWFFAARNNPDTAPLTVWLNGGVSCFAYLNPATEVLNIPKPGSSSMLGLVQEHGPCLINNDSSAVRLNPQSWNQNSNM